MQARAGSPAKKTHSKLSPARGKLIPVLQRSNSTKAGGARGKEHRAEHQCGRQDDEETNRQRNEDGQTKADGCMNWHSNRVLHTL